MSNKDGAKSSPQTIDPARQIKELNILLKRANALLEEKDFHLKQKDSHIEQLKEEIASLKEQIQIMGGSPNRPKVIMKDRGR